MDDRYRDPESHFDARERRQFAVEKDMHEAQTTLAVHDQKFATLEDNLEKLEKDVRNIDAKLNRIIWGVAAGAVGLLGQMFLSYFSFISHAR